MRKLQITNQEAKKIAFTVQFGTSRPKLQRSFHWDTSHQRVGIERHTAKRGVDNLARPLPLVTLLIKKGKGKMSSEDFQRPPNRTGKSSVHLTGRPARLKVIGKEDMLDLRIALETSRTVEEFLAQL